VRLPAKSSSFQHWAQRIEQYAQSDELRQELSYWESIGRRGMGQVPVDFTAGTNTEASARSVSVVLGPEETRALVQEVPAAYGTEVNDVLLAALAQALSRWTGRAAVAVELEGHGREDLFEGVDISRTVGWFTSIYPVVLEPGRPQGPGEVLTTIKEQLRRIPKRGIGFGLLRHLCADGQVRDRLAELPLPQVAFNYLGQFDQVLPEGSGFALAAESRGMERSLAGWRSHLVEINGGISGGVLRLEWTYSENLHRQSTIEAVAADFIGSLQRLIDHCLSPEAGGYTPSDFPDVELNSQDVEALVLEINENA
jgi:non-ribosomal peptide synthase protein (TIGR01720 family)